VAGIGKLSAGWSKRRGSSNDRGVRHVALSKGDSGISLSA
jgi:hypothetical protein